MNRHISIARPITAKEELKAIEEVLTSGMLAQGRAVSEFDTDENVNCPVAGKLANIVLSLPVHPALIVEDLKYIADIINNFEGVE